MSGDEARRSGRSPSPGSSNREDDDIGKTLRKLQMQLERKKAEHNKLQRDNVVMLRESLCEMDALIKEERTRKAWISSQKGNTSASIPSGAASTAETSDQPPVLEPVDAGIEGAAKKRRLTPSDSDSDEPRARQASAEYAVHRDATPTTDGGRRGKTRAARPKRASADTGEKKSR